MERNKTAIYPLSADPIHNGHIRTIALAVESGLFEKVYVGIGNDCNKKYLFNQDERLFLAKKALYGAGLAGKVTAESFTGLLRNYAKEKGIDFIVRGCRNAKDWEYEQLLSNFNAEYGLKTVIFPSSKDSENLSSTYVRSIAAESGFVDGLVHPSVKQALEERLRGVSLIGVTGLTGSGKSTLCQKLSVYSPDVSITHLNIDKMIHSLYNGEDFLSMRLRSDIGLGISFDVFEASDNPENRHEKIDRKKLGKIIFSDEEKRKKLVEILRNPLRITLEEEIRKRKGIVLLDASYLSEYNLLPLVNYNVINVTCHEKERLRRIQERDGISREEALARTSVLCTEEERRRQIQKQQEKLRHGFYYEHDSEEGKLGDVFEKINSSFPLKMERTEEK